MRWLGSQDNVNAPDSEYIYGRIRDWTSGVAGTPVNEALYGDIHQFIARMMQLSGLTPNGLPDNDYNGFQIFEAYKIAMYEDFETPTYSGSYQDDGSSPIRYRRKGKTIRIKGRTGHATGGSTSVSEQLFTLPTGYRPKENQIFTVPDVSLNNAAFVEVRTSGQIRLRGDLIAFVRDALYINIAFDID